MLSDFLQCHWTVGNHVNAKFKREYSQFSEPKRFPMDIQVVNLMPMYIMYIFYRFVSLIVSNDTDTDNKRHET